MKEIEENIGLIWKVIQDLHCNLKDEEEREEYFFNGLLGLYDGVRTYDKTKGIKKTTYYYTCIKYKIIWWFKKKPPKLLSLNTPIKEAELIEFIPDKCNLEQEIIKKEQLEYIYKAINKLKNSQYKRVFMEYYGINQEPKKRKELALKYGVSINCICVQIKQAIKKIRKEIEKEYYGKNIRKNKN